MSEGQLEFELKFRVPPEARRPLAAEMSRSTAGARLQRMQALYLDTADRHLARSGIAWRLRREGRRWVQTLKADGGQGLARWEHEVMRPDASLDVSAHGGTPSGERLAAALVDAQGHELVLRYRTDVRRCSQIVRTRGTVVEVALDRGTIVCGDRTWPIEEVEFELVSGSVAAMLALVRRWRDRFGLQLDPHSKAERGDWLSEGIRHTPVRRAQQPAYGRSDDAEAAFGAVIDECIAQILRNAFGLIDGDPSAREAHVHQMRVGIRRLRSANRCFRDWAGPMPPDLAAQLTTVFRQLGRIRERDVLSSALSAAIAYAGMPALVFDEAQDEPTAAQIVSEAECQQALLDLVAWRMGSFSVSGRSDIVRIPAGGLPDPKGAWAKAAKKRLRRWHRGIAAQATAIASLDQAALHALRKRVKRQRYATEFFAPVLGRRIAEPYLAHLAPLQDAMGDLNDLFTARDACQPLTASQPAASFAMGWTAAHIATALDRVERAFGRFAKERPPGD